MSFQCEFNPDTLAQMLPRNPNTNDWWNYLSQILPDFAIVTNVRVAAFMSQCAHESGEFTQLQENLNYNVDGLLRTFPRYFPNPSVAQAYARQPERIANRVYGGRMGNGPEQSGDGWRFRGRGLIQLTGKSNYAKCSADLYEDDRLLQDPNLLIQMPGAIYSACWFWHLHNLNELADAENLGEITKAINGGLRGFDQRCELYGNYMNLL